MPDFGKCERLFIEHLARDGVVRSTLMRDKFIEELPRELRSPFIRNLVFIVAVVAACARLRAARTFCHYDLVDLKDRASSSNGVFQCPLLRGVEIQDSSFNRVDDHRPFALQQRDKYFSLFAFPLRKVKPVGEYTHVDVETVIRFPLLMSRVEF